MELSDDLRAMLSARAATKIDALLAARETAYMAVRSFFEEAREASELVMKIRRRVQDQIDALPSPTIMWSKEKYAAYEAEVDTLRAPLRKAEADRDRLRARHEAAQQRLELHIGAGRAVEWLAKQKKDGDRFKDFPLPAVKTKSFQQEVDRIRGEIMSVSDQWNEAENAPCPIADAKAALADEIDAVAARGAPRFDMRRRPGPPLAFADQFRISLWQSNPESGHGLRAQGGGAEFLVWMMRDEIKAKLGAMIDQADVVGALT
ncbi:hypothetical protein PZ895_17630, partial [Mesorhizobium sp. YIM 152430]|uniref:hypothetical protein n=1 Tax=Mesorhizobium sp. YIM 152430 TaxID=3031761 RepID=UPI0023DACD7E